MSWRILTGDVRDVLKTLPDQSVQCVVTSPPYWGLRDYGTARWDGGDSGCQHTGSVMRTAPPGTAKQASNVGALSVRSGDCACGARRIDTQIGLESTPDAFTAELVAVFADVRRVLKDDGVVWLNLGDSYGTGGSGQNFYDPDGARPGGGRVTDIGAMGHRKQAGLRGFHKQLVGIPWRVAFALQADGWYLRSDIIWHKPNPMPESVTDRPTKSHEYVFLLSKSASYYYDAAAIAEPVANSTVATHSGRPASSIGPRSIHTSPPNHPTLKHPEQHQSGRALGNGEARNLSERNSRSVWTITTQPYPQAHFATFPEALPERCIKAGSRVGDLVLDPFCGAGTTGLVADRLGRDFIDIELSPVYVEMASNRIRSVTPLFSTETTEPIQAPQLAQAELALSRDDSKPGRLDASVIAGAESHRSLAELHNNPSQNQRVSRAAGSSR